jgi:hypothetical protein
MDPGADGDVSRRATVNFLQYEEWIDGHLLGMERMFKRASAQRDWDQVDIGRWISDYCQEHRLEVVANAALALSRKCAARLSEHVRTPRRRRSVKPPASRS